jgi:Ca2+-binding RTX toxin-like protein
MSRRRTFACIATVTLFSLAVVPSALAQSFSGTDGRDTFAGTAAADQVNGYAAADALSGAGGNDVLAGGAGADQLNGGTGSDTIYASSDSFTNERAFDDGHYDKIDCGAGTDTAYVSYGDSVNANCEYVSVRHNGTPAGDTISAPSAGAARYSEQAIYGLAGDDAITGNQYYNWIHGGPGSDSIAGGAGDDILSGGGDSASDRDSIAGGLGNDHIVGGPGNDSLRGGDGNDTIWSAHNVIMQPFSAKGADVVDCGAGIDEVMVDASDVVSASCEKVIVASA